MSSRRSFLVQLVTTVAAAGSLPVFAQAADRPARVPETDPTAQALGYKEDTTRVDKKKYPQHTPEQVCSGCTLYLGRKGEAEGPCTAFAGKHVTANGWCMAYVKKP